MSVAVASIVNNIALAHVLDGNYQEALVPMCVCVCVRARARVRVCVCVAHTYYMAKMKWVD